MKSKDDKIKSFIVTIVIAVFLFITIASFAYAYFSANITINQNLNVITSISDAISPVFTASVEGELSLYASTADMLQSESNSSNTTVGDTASQVIEIVFIAGGGEETSTASCTYDFTWTNTGTLYTPTSSLGSLKEYTLKIVDDKSAVILAETQISNFTSGNAIVTGQSITSTGSEVTRTYTVTATIYNLNMAQTIYNKEYNSTISVTNVTC